MQITNEQVIAAARAGAELLASDDVRVPAAQMGNLILLRELLAAVAAGHLVIARPEKKPAATEEKPSAAEEKPSRTTKRAAGSNKAT